MSAHRRYPSRGKADRESAKRETRAAKAAARNKRAFFVRPTEPVSSAPAAQPASA
jgi:hypothetical protein